jgi:hypothetical protein
MPIAATLALLLLAATLSAQSPSDDARLQTVLARATQAEADLNASLPSFTCKEDVLSDEIDGSKKHKLIRHVAFTADIRVERRADGELHETFEPASWASILTQSRGIGIPYYVSGGFQRALTYFDPAQSACYRFALTANRLDFAAATDALRYPACKDETGLTGFALLDPAGDIVHLERTVPEQLSRRTALTPFAAIDLAPTTLNGHTYRLSTRVLSDGPGETHHQPHGHFEATYSACRLFHTTVTIEPNP